jgi:voltage-gated potassium channel
MSWRRALATEISTVLQLARREKLTWLAGIIISLILLGSVCFFFAERQANPNIASVGDALYWGIVSATTTGYGDITPQTPLGRGIAAGMLLCFMGLMPIVWATVTSIYVSKKIKGERGLEKVNLEGHLLVCGWNNNGYNLLAGLLHEHEKGHVVIIGELASDHYEDIAQRFPEMKLHYVKGQYANEATLLRANVKYARAAIVLSYYGVEPARSDDTAVLAVLALRELAPGIRIVAECFSSGNKVHLYRAGADRVIVSGEFDGYLLTAATLSPGLDLALKDAMSFGSANPVWTHPVPAEMAGKSFKELAMHWLDQHGWVVLGLVRGQVQLGVESILSGDRGSIDEFILRRFEQAGKGRSGRQSLHYLNPGAQQLIKTGDLAIVIRPLEATGGR